MLAYWKLLMRDRLMALAPGGRRREGQAAWKAVLGWAGITLLAVSLFAMAVLFEMVMYDQAKAMGEPQAVIALAFLACTLMTLIYSFFYVISLLFFGRDCAFVGALPIPSHGVLLAKLATVLAGEIGLTALVCLPLLIRYGVETGAAADYYVRSLLGTLFIPGIPVAITTLLSFALIRISALWKRREGVTTVMTFVLVAAIVGVEMSINMNMDEGELAQAAAGLLLGSGSLTELVLGAFPPLQWLTTAATGSGLHAWGQAALYAGVSIAALALVVALCGGGYMRLALRQAEVIQRVNSGSRRRSAGAHPLLGAVPAGDARGAYCTHLRYQLPHRCGNVPGAAVGNCCRHRPGNGWDGAFGSRGAVCAQKHLSGGCRGLPGADLHHGVGRVHRRVA